VAVRPREDAPRLADQLQPFLVLVMDVRARAQDLVATRELSLEEIWLLYFSVGGTAGLLELEAFIYGVELLSRFDLRLLECALQDTPVP
jgi:hypothetical protein